MIRDHIQVAVGFLLIIAASSVYAADWQFLAQDRKNSSYFDPGSVTREGPFIKVWILWNIPNGVDEKHSDGKFYTAKSLKSLNLFSCKEGKFAQTREISYSKLNAGGKILHDETKSHGLDDAKWVAWPPDTLFYKELRALCARLGETVK